MKNPFESFFKKSTPEKERTDGAQYIAIPNGGNSDLDIPMEDRSEDRITREIARLAKAVEDHHNGIDIGADISFVTEKLANLRAGQEKGFEK